MKSAALLMSVLLAASGAAMAKPHHGHRHAARVVHHANAASERESHPGITPAEKDRAKRCLAEKS